jgi:hypothetical protein
MEEKKTRQEYIRDDWDDWQSWQTCDNEDHMINLIENKGNVALKAILDAHQRQLCALDLARQYAQIAQTAFSPTVSDQNKPVKTDGAYVSILACQRLDGFVLPELKRKRRRTNLTMLERIACVASFIIMVMEFTSGFHRSFSILAIFVLSFLFAYVYASRQSRT